MQAVDEQVLGRPPTRWRGAVARWSGWRQAGLPPARHLGLPSPWLTVIVTLDDPLVLEAHPDPARPPHRFDALVGGLHTRPAVVTHDGQQSGVQLAVHPLAARALLGCPAGAIAGQDVEGADLLGAGAAELQERVRGAGDWPARFAAVDQALSRLAAAGRREPAGAAELARAFTLLARGWGAGAVGADIGWSPRRLSARFGAEVGVSPQTLGRLARFERGQRTLRARHAAGQRLDLAAVAADGGWYDQAHLARDFREFTGTSPTGWLAAEQPTADPS